MAGEGDTFAGYAKRGRGQIEMSTEQMSSLGGEGEEG